MVRSIIALAAFAVLSLPLGARAEMSEQDRQARCANNQARMAELERQLGDDPYPEEVLRDDRIYLSQAQDEFDRGIADWQGSSFDAAETQIDMALGSATRLAAAMHFNNTHDCKIWNNPITRNLRLDQRVQIAGRCISDIKQELIRRTSESDRSRVRRASLEPEIARYRTNLIALHCDEPAPAQSAGPGATGWQSAGSGDCPGKDEASSSGALPDPGMCTAERAGKAAVCWDGKTYVNHYGETHGAPAYPWCTYKSTGSCGGGSNTGLLYICRP